MILRNAECPCSLDSGKIFAAIMLLVHKNAKSVIRFWTRWRMHLENAENMFFMLPGSLLSLPGV